MASTQIYKCPHCKAPLSFHPEVQGWKCQYCFSVFQEKDLKKEPVKEEQRTPSDSNLNNYHCSNCGAEILSDENTLATFCIYCKSPTIIKSRFHGEFHPKYVIPFQLTKEQAKGKYLSWIRKRFLAPTSFQLDEELEKLTGMYAPFWIFDCTAMAQLEGSATIVRTHRSGDYEYTSTKHYHVARGGQIQYEKVPVDAATKLDDHYMNLIEPFDYSQLTSFSMEYLSGFLAEKYDVDENTCKLVMQKRVETFASQRLRETISGYSSFTESHSDALFTDLESAYALFPVYILVNRYKEKDHVFLVNGQTGKVVGNTPIDRKKQILFFLAVFLGTWILSLLGGALLV